MNRESKGSASLGSPRLHSFHELMRHRVLRILLVSSLYDSFIMAEEGQLHETLLSQFVDLHLSQIPDLVQVPTAAEALAALEEERAFDLVIASLKRPDGTAVELVHDLRAAGHSVPVIGLAYSNFELLELADDPELHLLERLFLWQGDVRILLAMVKYMEDRLNVEQDTGGMGVPAILVVEDSVRFYSSFLPTIYTEILRHSHRLLSEDLNLSQKMLRMRARAKVLLCTTYEEAWDTFERYQDQILGILSDFEFPRGGALTARAGLELCQRVHEERPDIRLVMQSSHAENQELAEGIGASFLLKGSPLLLNHLRRLLVERFGFGDFVFRLPDGSEVERAENLRTLAAKLESVPGESVRYHAERNHFANWFKARTEFDLAERLDPRAFREDEDPEELRTQLLAIISDSRAERQRTLIVDFDRKKFEPTVSFTRIGGGALGGKARGVAFANRLLQQTRIGREFPEVDIDVPPSVVLGTEVFDEFLEHGWHREFAIGQHPDEEILRHFVAAPFPRSAIAGLRAFLQRVKYPLAVRSSSLLEDSLSQPFAGVYQTHMLPNNDLELDARWDRLATAVKRVYASAFLAQAKTYLSMTSFRLEEEKMAIMIQELVGRQHGDRYYPDFAGVARSHNDYPEPGHAAEDGVVAVALGLGHSVVGGRNCLRFSPRNPQHIVSFSTVKDALDGSQREFAALDLARLDPHQHQAPEGSVRLYPLELAEEDGLLQWLGSTYLADDDRIVDGISREGVRLVSFAQVLKHGAFPLAEIVSRLLDRCSEGAGAPVEIEFAGNLPRKDARGRFAFLQLRPLALAKERRSVEIGDPRPEEVVCRSRLVLGNGALDDVRDLVIVDPDRFERSKSPEVALEVARFDALLRKAKRPYVLVGVGRWGSSDPHLGIPVSWNQIAGARVIVESGLRDLRVAPSQGTHFFQNLTAYDVGYFTVNPDAGQGELDWEWLLGLAAQEEAGCVRHCRLPAPLRIRISGTAREGVILRPEA